MNSQRFVAFHLVMCLLLAAGIGVVQVRATIADAEDDLLAAVRYEAALLARLLDSSTVAQLSTAKPEDLIATFERLLPDLPLVGYETRVLLVGREGRQVLQTVEPALEAESAWGAALDHWLFRATAESDAAMTAALAGQSGVLRGRTEQGLGVMAAYAPLPGAPYGVVAQLPLAELRRAVLICIGNSIGLALLCAALAALLFGRLIAPLIHRLERGETLFHALFQSSDDAVLLLDNLTVVVANDRASRLFGRSPAALQGGVLSDLLTRAHGGLSPDQLSRYARAAAAGQTAEFMVAMPAEGGELRLAEGRLKAVEIGGRTQLMLTLRDITEAEQARRELEDARARFGRLFESSMDGLLLVDPASGCIEDCSERARQILGVTLNDALRGRACLAPLQELIRAWDDAGREDIFHSELKLTRPDGQQIWADVAVRRLELAGHPTLLIRIAETTEVRRQQQALEDLNEKMQMVLRETRVGTFWFDIDLGVVRWDATTFEIHGLPPRAGLIGLEAVQSLIHPDDLAGVLRWHEELLSTGHGSPGEYRVIWPDRSIHHMHTRAHVRLEGGRPVSIFGVTVDLSETRHLREISQNLATAVEQIQDAVLILNSAGRTLYVNRAFEQMSGLRCEEMLGRQPHRLLNDRRQRRPLSEIVRAVRRGETWRGRVRHLNAAGQELEMDLSVAPVLAERAQLGNVVIAIHDITGLLGLEQQLHQSQKMEAIGRLAGGMAHDFNNLLTVILGYSEMLMQIAEGDFVQESVREILTASHRASALTRQLLVFARRQVVEPRVVDLNELIRNMQKMLLRLIGEDIELKTRLAEDLQTVWIDPGQFEQLVLNLVVNARDAMPQGGRIEVSTDNRWLDAMGTEGKLPAGHYVCLRVADEGCGMDAELITRIFEPFFTTKDQGKGTGLGLSTVYGIVHQAGGGICVESEPGAGAVFLVYLPVNGEAPSTQGSGTQGGSMPRGHETILLAEDEPQVRMMTADILAKLGYRVLVAADGQEAAEKLTEEPGEIHLLLTDVVMPRMNGRLLAEECARLRPSTAILFISGYAENAIAHNGIIAEGLEFLSKPFSPAGLARKVRGVLDAAAERLEAVGGSEAPAEDEPV